MESYRYRQSGKIARAIALALRTSAPCAPLALLLPGMVAAQPVVASLAADIPAQPLVQALNAFANASGLQLIYVSGVVGDQQSRATPAGLSPDAALAHLLRGTGLKFQYLTPYSVRILSAAQSASRATESEGPAQPEIIVTANRRTGYPQDTPMALQVLTGTTLSQLNVGTFEDIVGYLPGVVARGTGPSQNSIYMRGLGTSDIPNQAAGSAGSFPNVAVYLDEQSTQLPGRNLDVYAADLERVEVLEGPQGTQFGAGAEAGVLRYITKKPKLNVTEAIVNARYAHTAHGAPSSAADLTLNVPVIDDTLALRGVIYSERRGGYIDNIPATFARADTDAGIVAFFGGHVPANSTVINNSTLVGKDINPVAYQGLRLEALYQASDAWSVLLSQSFQSMEADGAFAEAITDPQGMPQPPLTVQLYNAAFDRDRFENTALTVKGHVGSLDLVYAGSYLVRNVKQVQDYTNYARGGSYAGYYQCVGASGSSVTPQCFTPSATWHDTERNTHESHELRLSTPPDLPVRALGGLFYETSKIQDQGDFFYLTALPYFNPIAPPAGYYVNSSGQLVCTCAGVPPGATFVPAPATSNNPNVRASGDGFFNDITRRYTQEALFASVDADVLPKVLTLTVGTRYFRERVTEVGSVVDSFGCQLINFPDAPNPCATVGFINIDARRERHTSSGFRSRANLTFRPADDMLLYYTFSQGVRVGGFNRPYFAPSGDSPLASGPQAIAHGGYTPPVLAAADTLTNNEVGWKTTWWDRHLQWNGALYQENWNNAQLDSSAISPSITVNGGNYRVRGLESSLEARVDGLSFVVGGAWNRSTLIKEAALYWNDGTRIDFSTLTNSDGSPFANPTGTVGSPLAGAPQLQANARARYELIVDDYHAFVQVGAVHQSHSRATTDRTHIDLQGNSIDYVLAPFTTYTAALGAGRNGWMLELYGENLTDTRAQLFANSQLYYKAVTVNRPRTLGVHVSYSYGGT